jgi:hypothetical protein
MFKLLVILAFIALAVLVTRFLNDKNTDFKSQAKMVQATVTNKVEHYATKKKTREEHVIRYEFTVDGKNYSGEDTVEFDDLWARVKEGDKITIYYHPENPLKNHPAALLDRRLNMAQKVAGWTKQ